MKTSVVIPAFDRIESLRSVLQEWRRSGDNTELVVVDDKSPHAKAIEDIANQHHSLYVRNPSRKSEREPALCRNLGFNASSGDVVVFNDADVLPAPNALELHRRYAEKGSVVVDAQVWNIAGGQAVVNKMQRFTIDELTSVSQPAIQDQAIVWSTFEHPIPSNNWWAFLSAQCSFRRKDLLRIGRWDEGYSGWGVEDNDIGYRICKEGLRIIYARDVRCFHIDHSISREEYREKCRSALRNLRLMCEKYPEVAADERVRSRLQELERLIQGDFSYVVRQETVGGGPIERGDREPV